MSSVKRGTLAVACLATAMLMLDVAVLNTAIPHMGIDLHVFAGCGNDDGWSDPRTIAELAGAALFLASFVVDERRAPAPMLPLALCRVPAFAGAQVSALAISVSFLAMYLYATLYLQDVLGLSARQTGIAVGIAALGALIRVNAVGSHRSLYVHDLPVALVAAADAR